MRTGKYQNQTVMETTSSGDRRCFDSNHNSTSLEVGRQYLVFRNPTPLIASRRMMLFHSWSSSGRKGMIETHKSATSFAMILLLVFFFDLLSMSVTNGEATFVLFQPLC